MSIEMKQQTVGSLNLEEYPIAQELLEKSEVIVCDIDYTLLNIEPGHQLGVDNIAKIFDRELADRFNNIFHIILEGHRKRSKEPWGQREEFQLIMDKMRKLQRGIPSYYGLKYWSKETMILIASQEAGRKVTAQNIIAGRDGYWRGRNGGSRVYNDVVSFADRLEKLGKPLILMTGSYSILQVGEDFSLRYDPIYSEKYKRESLKDVLPFPYQEIVIGDPIDKPDPRFFDKLLKRIKNDPEKILVIGDSDRNDLELPRQLGCPTLLIRRD